MALILGSPSRVVSLISSTYLPEPQTAPVRPKTAPRSIDELISDASLKYGVSEAVMRKVVACESTFNPNAIGDGGKSFGLVQIHLPSHPYVSREEALNPEFAVEFLAKNLSLGKGRMWTCYRNLPR